MKKMDKKNKDNIILYIKYFVTSFVSEKMPEEEKEIILKCFLYKRSQKEIQNMLLSVERYKKDLNI
jgi:DNA-directed RNA polymerase specialized sigma subunit